MIANITRRPANMRKLFKRKNHDRDKGLARTWSSSPRTYRATTRPAQFIPEAAAAPTLATGPATGAASTAAALTDDATDAASIDTASTDSTSVDVRPTIPDLRDAPRSPAWPGKPQYEAHRPSTSFSTASTIVARGLPGYDTIGYTAYRPSYGVYKAHYEPDSFRLTDREEHLWAKWLYTCVRYNMELKALDQKWKLPKIHYISDSGAGTPPRPPAGTPEKPATGTFVRRAAETPAGSVAGTHAPGPAARTLAMARAKLINTASAKPATMAPPGPPISTASADTTWL